MRLQHDWLIIFSVWRRSSCCVIHSFIHNISGDTHIAHHSIYPFLHHQLILYEEMMTTYHDDGYDDDRHVDGHQVRNIILTAWSIQLRTQCLIITAHHFQYIEHINRHQLLLLVLSIISWHAWLDYLVISTISVDTSWWSIIKSSIHQSMNIYHHHHHHLIILINQSIMIIN